MFKKKLCQNCGNKVGDKYRFCPCCGVQTNKNLEENWGMLGKNDSVQHDDALAFPMGLGTLFNALMKNLNNQFSELNKEMGMQNNLDKKNFNKEAVPIKKGISISISTSGNNPPKIKISQMGNCEKKQIKRKNFSKNFSENNLKKLSKLVKKEPLTEIKRLSNELIYEINLPGVKSLDDISILNLENSIEIKALTKTKAYVKVIPISLPMKNYEFANEKLILEFGDKN